MRVYELAKEYGKKSTDFVDIIQSFGIDVKSHLSSLDDDRVVEIRNKLDTKQVAIDLENDLLSRKIKSGMIPNGFNIEIKNHFCRFDFLRKSTTTFLESVTYV